MSGVKERPAEAVGAADPREVRAAKILADRLLALTRGEPMTRATLEAAQECVDDFWWRAIMQGVKLPKMAVLMFPAQGTMEVVRADLTREALNGLVLKLTQRYPGMKMEELAASIARGFPHFAPDRAEPGRHFRPLLVK